MVPLDSRPELLGFTLGALVVVGHLQTGSSETALDVEALVCLAAVEDGLVAARLLGDKVECLDQPQTQLLALLILGNRDVFDVTDHSKAMDAVLGRSVLAMSLECGRAD